MSKQFLIILAAAAIVIGVAIFFVFSSTKGAHLRLEGKILKVRTGALDEQSSAAVVDFRVTNPSDVPFVVRDVTVTLEKADSSTTEATLIAKSDLKTLLAYNKFLGAQYNDAVSIRDKIAPHATVDRMVALRFEVPLATLNHAGGLKLNIQDLDGPEWETEYRF